MTGGRPPQRFHFGPWVYLVDQAQEILAAAAREPQALTVSNWATAYGLTRLDDPDPRMVSLIGPYEGGLDRAYAMTTDLTIPVIVAQLDEVPPVPLLIDGVHRLYHAWRTQVAQLPAYLLTTDETSQIAQHRHRGSAPAW